MARALRVIGDVAYWLGLISVVLAVLVRFVTVVAMNIPVSARGGVMLGGALFLCSLASRETAKAA